jgi:glycogen(starch) synthase
MIVMRIILLSWEYPPRRIGKLADYVSNLAHNLSQNNFETYVVTYHEYLTGKHEESNGIKTYRIRSPVHTHSGVLTWVLTLNQEVERAVADIYYTRTGADALVVVCDWHFIPAAVTLKKAFNLPFIYSVDSLEDHRSHSTGSVFNMSIKSIEWLGLYEAARIVVKSEWMKDEVCSKYRVPFDKVKALSKSARWADEVIDTYDWVWRRK